jgi:hypothetical protein
VRFISCRVNYVKDARFSAAKNQKEEEEEEREEEEGKTTAAIRIRQKASNVLFIWWERGRET